MGQQESEILLGHVMMLQDPSLQGQIDQELEAGHCAEQALATVCDRYIALFSSVDDAMTQQRAADIRDIKEELLSRLTGTARLDLTPSAAGDGPGDPGADAKSGSAAAGSAACDWDYHGVGR